MTMFSEILAWLRDGKQNRDSMGKAMRKRRQRRAHAAARARLAVEALEDRVVMSSNLVAAYNFDAGSGAVLADLSGNGNNGTISNATWSQAGKYSGALQFTGALNSWVTIPNATSLQLTSGMTLEAWADPTSLSSPDMGWDSVISKEHRNSVNDISYALYAATGTGTGPGGHILVGNSDKGSGSGSVLPLNRWVFLAATYDGTNIRVYVNGSLVSTKRVNGNIFSTSDPLRIGGDWSGEMFTGLIDNIRIYNTPLTQTAIQTDMTTPVSGRSNLQVSVTAPSNAADVHQTVTVSATATDNVPVTGLQFYLDGNAVGSYQNSAPFSYSWDTTKLGNGMHTLTAEADDASGNSVTSQTVTVLVDNSPPMVSITSPSAGSDLAGTVTVNANASDNVGVTGVQFYVDGNPVGALDTSSPYSYTLDTTKLTDGTHVLTAQAFDGAGNSTTASSVSIVTDNTAPTVSITAPSAGAYLANTVNVNANAADNIGVVSLQFYIDGNAVGSPESAAPYSYSWDTTQMADGTHTLTAKATDGAGNVTTSSTVSVTVENAAPVVTSVFPTNGTNGAGLNTLVTATFNQSMNAATITGSTFELFDPNGNLVSASISYNAATNTATLTPGAMLANATTYTAVVVGGSSGVANMVGTPLALNYSWSFTTGSKPTATFSGPTSVNEGTTNASVAFTNQSGGTGGYTYSYDFNNDGRFEITGSSNASATIPESYLDDGPGTAVIHGRITDSSGTYSDYTWSITENNVAPTPSITPPSGADATVAATFIASASDPSTADTTAGFTYSWTFGDGSGPVSGARPSHTYTQPGTYTITLRATDKDHGVGTVSTSFTVSPLPSASFSGPTSVTEGTSNAQVAFTGAIGGSGSYTYSYDFNDDGNFEITGSSNATVTVPESYLDDGPSTHVIHGRISDGVGGYSDYTTTIGVTNVPPTPSITLPSGADATVATSFTGSATDPSTADTSAGFTYAWDFGDGTSPGSGAHVSHTYTQPGTYTITLTATDKDGGVGTTTGTLTVASLPTANFSGPPMVNEGTSNASAAFTGQSGGIGSYTYSYDFNNDGNFEITGSSSASVTIPESYLDDGSMSRTIHGRITDSVGGYSDYTYSIMVMNVAPTPTMTRPSAIDVTVPAAFRGTATDPSTADTSAGFTYSWNFGDGTMPSAGANVSHTFTRVGTYTVTLSVTDKDGGVGTTSASVTVNALPTATFGAPSSVTEGTTTAKATFTSPTGGSGSYTYSYDFNNDGNFEVTGSSSASATIPESYLDDSGTLTVHGRITDSLGGYSDYTSSITINDAAPTPTITPPGSLVSGLPSSFSGSATSPSTADNRIGFTFSWTFGDGGTGSGANPSHTYAAPGTYTVTLTAVDADGGTPGSTSTTVTVTSSNGDYDPYINTPYLHIPNFGAHPTIVSVANGNWSNPATWSLGRVPQAGDVVDINPGFAVTYDLNDATNAIALNTVEVQPTATLSFRTDINTQICVANFMVLQGGNLVVGTAANPIAPTANVNIDIANLALNSSSDPSQFGDGLIALGNVTMHGATKTPYATLATEPHAADTTLKFAQPVTGWQAGDDLMLPDTRQLDYGGDYSTYKSQLEQLTIKSVSADGLTVTLTTALKYTHLGGHDAKGNLMYLPQVMNDHRNIMVESQSMTGTRGYTLFTYRANIDIEYAGFCELGRTTTSAPSGANIEERYAMTMLDLIGPTSPQANGYQFTLIGNAVDNDGDGNGSNPSNIQWGMAVNNSFYGLIQSNVVDSVSGAGIGVEDGASSYNRFDSNFVANVIGTSNRPDQALQGDGFWFGNPNNYVTNNIATDINGGGWTVYSYGFNIDVTGGEYSSNDAGDTSAVIPIAQGADPTVSGQSKTVNMNDTPILQFSGNEVYGATSSGMTVWWVGTFGDNFYSDSKVSTVKNFTAWNIGTRAFYGYPVDNLVIDGATILGDTSWDSNPSNYTQGINFDDYMTRNLVIQNCNIQGMMTGIQAPFMVGRVATMDTTIIQNCTLDNVVNIDLTPPRSVNGSSGLSPQTLDILNCMFYHPSAAPTSWWLDIDMDYVTSDALGTSNMNIKQYVYVTNYNDVVGDNFQVFYSQSNSPTGAPPSGAKPRALIGGLVLPD
jgi:surface-anchored protein